MLANKGPNGDPIATPSIRIYISVLNLKQRCFVQSNSSSLGIGSGIEVLIFFSTYTFCKIVSSVSSTSTLVNKL